MPRSCVNNADNFCYVCKETNFASQQRRVSPIIRKAYHLYFGCRIKDQDKGWAPHICCGTCITNLQQWLFKKRKSIPFAVPMIWREPTNHTDDCYFCMLLLAGVCLKKRKNVDYPDIPSAIRPVPHGKGLPVPTPPELVTLKSEDEEECSSSYPERST